MTELIQCLFLIALGGIIWNLRRDATQTPFVLWTWAWLIAMTASFYISAFHDAAIVSFFVPLFPAFLLAGALSYARRPIPRWLLPAAIVIGGVRSILAWNGAVAYESMVGLAFEPTTVFLAAYLLFARDRGTHSLIDVLLPASFLVLGANQAVVSIARLIGSNPTPIIAWGWILAVPPSIALQAIACHRWSAERQRERSQQSHAIRRALGTSQERFRALTENSSQLILELDSEGRIVYSNPRVHERLGYPHAVLAGRQLRDFIHSDHQERSFPPDSKETTRPERIRRWRTSDGDWIWIESTIRPFPGDDNRPHWVVSANDVTQRHRLEADLRESRDQLEIRVEERTAELGRMIERLEEEMDERKSAELALRENEERYRVVSELSSDWSFEFSVEPGGAIGSGWAQPNLVRITGFTTERLLRGGYFSIVHPEDVERVRAEFQQLVSGSGPGHRQVVESQHRILTSDGGFRWLHTIMEAEEERSGQVRVIGAASDVTEQHLAEEERERLDNHLRDVQRLESLGVLADRIAHGFNNQLTVILGNSSLALSEVPRDTALHERLQRIRAAAQQSSSLTDQMLVYAGKTAPSLKAVHLPHMLEGIRELLEASISRRCKLHLDIASPLPLVKGDEGQLQQVAVNLVTNASESLSQESGHTWLRAGAMSADRAYLDHTFGSPNLEEGEYVYLEVEDDGSGIDPDDRGRIFEPFFTTRFSGRGLGLAAVLGIVQAHGGAIKLQSKPGRGTCIRVLLPSANTKSAAARGPHATKTPQGAQVLVVDDDEAVRDLMTELLSRAGFQVTNACDGFEAVDRVREKSENFAAILLDIDMPGPNDGKTLQALRQLKPEVPVVVASAFEENEILKRVGDQKISGIVLKPFDEHQLTETIEDAIELGAEDAAFIR